MQVYLDQESPCIPKSVEYHIGLVDVCKNIRESTMVKNGVESVYYLYDLYRYETMEYNIKLSTDNEKLWDTVEYLLKQTGDIPVEVVVV